MIKRIMSVLLSFALFSGSVTTVHGAEDGNPEFDRFLDEQFIETMEDDYLSMHYSVRDYSSYGIEKPERNVGDASWESFANEAESKKEALEELHKFDYESLSDRQKVDYDAMEFYLSSMADLNSYPTLSGYFEPNSGLQDTLVTNFTEFLFYGKEDVEDYLEVLADVPNFMDEAVRVTKRQAEAGYFMTDAALDESLDAIERFTAKKNNNELIVVFDENIAAMDDLTAAEITDFQKKNRDIVINDVIPAYERAGKALESLRGSRSFEGGMCNYENGGKEYYEALVRAKTSSSDSIEAQLDLLTDYLMELVNDYVTLVMTNPAAENQYDFETVTAKTPDDILEFLSGNLADFPDSADVTYKYSYLDPSVATESTVAYYMVPPIDDFHNNVIRINGDSVSDENELYETLAHEGFPGHLYQITWYLATDPAPIRRVLHNLGYIEGWAMYSEMYGWEESGLSEGAIEMHKIFTALGYAEDAAVDLGVNGLGWDVDDVAEYLDSIGLNPSQADMLYEFVLKFPGILLPYGVGLARFATMREIAEETLGNSFDLKKFHEVMLTNGDRPFEMVTRDFNAYLNGGDVETGKPETKPEFSPEPFDSQEWEQLISNYHHRETSSGALTVFGIFGVLAAVMFFLVHNGKRKGPLA